MLIIRCPRCNKNNVFMVNFWDEYLCKECLKKENKLLRQRQAKRNETNGKTIRKYF